MRACMPCTAQHLVSPLESLVPLRAPPRGHRLRRADGVEAEQQLLQVLVDHAVPALPRQAVPPRREDARTPANISGRNGRGTADRADKRRGGGWVGELEGLGWVGWGLSERVHALESVDGRRLVRSWGHTGRVIQPGTAGREKKAEETERKTVGRERRRRHHQLAEKNAKQRQSINRDKTPAINPPRRQPFPSFGSLFHSLFFVCTYCVQDEIAARMYRSPRSPVAHQMRFWNLTPLVHVFSTANTRKETIGFMNNRFHEQSVS